MRYKYGEITGAVIGAAMEVHKVLHNGFRELVYQRSLAIELNIREINYSQEVEIPIFYKGTQVGLRRVDFLIDEKIPIEIKAVENTDGKI